ncbi:hypothetical protein GX917_00120 [Candidatus Falkowbacteria bacterium]|jgi:hypothetical protein|nr:hypothetical protein [Candidatus Falkowbacteria bacterium]
MFNNLTNQTNPHKQEVDDIFAETDKPAASGLQPEIEVRNVGLASSGETLELADDQAPEKRNYLKLIIIITLSLAILGGAYLVYAKVFKGNLNNNAEIVPVNSGKVESPLENQAPKSADSDFVDSLPGVEATPVSPVVIPGEEATSSETDLSDIEMSSEIDSPLEGEAVIPLPEITEPVSMIDSDGDGLTDEEEILLGTNINVIDTDGDGLSDYEEVKIYKTNPLSADTDGDGYLDGEEVKNGYDPNRVGAKLSDN